MTFDFWTAYWAFVAFVFGAIVGSFLNVCILRLPQGKSVSTVPSHCPSCDHRLRMWPDMVPLASQLWYRARCRYCGTNYSWRYFWVELFTALMFMAIYLRFVPFGNPAFTETQQTVISACAMLFAAALITIFFIDLDTFEINEVTVLLALLAGIGKDIYLIASGARSLWQNLPGIPFAVPIPVSVLGALLAFWLMWQFAAIASAAMGREAMGGGDSILLGAMGAFLVPWPLVVVAFLLSVALGSVGGIAGKLLWKEPLETSSEESAAESEDAAALGTVTGTEASEEIAPNLNGHAELNSEIMSDAESASEEPLYAHVHAVEHAVEEATSSLSQAIREEAAPNSATESAGPDETAVFEESEPPFPVDDDGAPLMPAGSRWGRLLTVTGSWLAVGSLYAALAQYQSNPTGALAVGAIGVLSAAVLLFFGIRMWVAADTPFLEQMDAYFDDGEPGPRFIPFGPYLVVGSFAAMLFGRELVEMYCRFNGIELTVLQTLPWEVPSRLP